MDEKVLNMKTTGIQIDGSCQYCPYFGAGFIEVDVQFEDETTELYVQCPACGEMN